MNGLKAKFMKAALPVAVLAGSAMAYTADYPIADSPDIWADAFNTTIVTIKANYLASLIGLFVLGVLIEMFSGFFSKTIGRIWR